MEEIPLLIIGAGPAGLSTALHLIQLDPAWAGRMILLDRAAHPRHKLCGGGVTQLGLRHLRDLQLPDPLPVPHAIVTDARFRYRGRVVHVIGTPEIAVFHRLELDNYLAETAKTRGIHIRENERVQSVEPGADGVIVRTDRAEYLARAVVGADGSRGVTRKVVAGEDAPIRVARLLEGVHPARSDAPQFTDRYALFDFTPVEKDLQGYAWDFPARVDGAPHHNRGVYDARMARSRPKAGLPGLLDAALTEMGSDAGSVRVEGHPIHWFSPRSILSRERILLAGDAAGAEPLFGEGIAPALAYGKIAAGVLDEAFKKQNYSFKDYRRRVLLSRLGAYMLLRWYVAWWSYRLCSRPWFMHVMWTIGRGLAAVKRGLNVRTTNPSHK